MQGTSCALQFLHIQPYDMKKLFLVLGLCISGIALWAQDCSDLFFSEYVEGSGNNKGMEIYNPTDKIVTLSSYYVARYSNGNLTFESGGITQLQGFLQPYSTHFLVNGQTVTTETSPACDPALQAMAQQLDHDYPAPTYMNGNDAIALFKDPVGDGKVTDFLVVDLFGIIGGGMQSSDEGWTDFSEQWAYKNIYDGEEIIGKDSTFIQHYIVPDSYYWLPWTSNHSLVRKATVQKGVTTNPATEFVVTMEWDTVPGGVNVWDSLGMHICDCEPTNAIQNGFEEDLLDIYPNPARNQFIVTARVPFEALTLYDASGREVYHENLTQGAINRTININGFPAGFYHLRVKFSDRHQVEKVMIH